MSAMDELFFAMVREGASDLHLSPGHSPYFRILGQLIKVKTNPLTKEKCEKLIKEISPNQLFEDLQTYGEIKWIYELPGHGRFRAHVFNDQNGPNMVFHYIPSVLKSIEELMLPDAIRSWVEGETRGLVLVAGQIGSGKSTTFHALINHINENYKERILTLEKFIEYKHSSGSSLITQKQIVSGSDSHLNTLKSVVSRDVDVLGFDEIEERQTARLALEMADAGPLVMGVIKAQNCVRAISQFLDKLPLEEVSSARKRLSENLIGIVTQSLLPQNDQKGVVPVFEVVQMTAIIRNQIKDGHFDALRETVKNSSIRDRMSFEYSLKERVRAKLISQTVADRFLSVYRL